MKDKLIYTGIATLIRRVDGNTTYSKYYNNGTNKLFELYARALAGQNISSLLPYSLDFTIKDVSKLRNNVYISSIYNPHSEDTSINPYGVPFTRIEALFTRDMFDIPSDAKSAKLNLKSRQDNILATIEVDEDFIKNIISTSPGVQLILVWDLYVNNSNT